MLFTCSTTVSVIECVPYFVLSYKHTIVKNSDKVIAFYILPRRFAHSLPVCDPDPLIPRLCSFHQTDCIHICISFNNLMVAQGSMLFQDRGKNGPKVRSLKHVEYK